jgi:hypothetical protein
MARGLRAENSNIVVDEASMLTFDIDKVGKQLDNVMVKVFGDKPKLIEDIYFHREKEENWGLEEKAEKAGFKTPHDMLYLGSEIGLKVEITANHVKVIEKSRI